MNPKTQQRIGMSAFRYALRTGGSYYAFADGARWGYRAAQRDAKKAKVRRGK